MRWRALAPALLIALAGDARAHAFSPDAGHFYNGLMHAFIDPGQVLILLGLGLLAAQRDLVTARTVVIGMPLLALIVSALPVPADWLPAAEAGVLLGAGLVALSVVLARPCAAHWLQGLALVSALGPGLVNAAELARASWLVPRLYLSGAALGIFLLLMSCFVLASTARRLFGAHAELAMRVLASWLLAGSLLLLALRWA